jgi:hypothetical protein
MPKFDVVVNARDEDGKEFYVGELKGVEAEDREKANLKAYDEVWDRRLDIVYCSPSYVTEEVDPSSEEDSGPTPTA